MCQINTEQMKQELGCLDVNVPPDIDMNHTSSDLMVQVREGVKEKTFFFTDMSVQEEGLSP